VPDMAGKWKACISFQLALLVWRVAGPVCLDLKKLQDTGLVEGAPPAAAERRQRGRGQAEACVCGTRGGGQAGRRGSAERPRGQRFTSSASVSLWGKATVADIKSSPGCDELSVSGIQLVSYRRLHDSASPLRVSRCPLKAKKTKGKNSSEPFARQI